MQRSGYLDDGLDGDGEAIESFAIQYENQYDDGNDEEESGAIQPAYIITEEADEEEEQNNTFQDVHGTKKSANRVKGATHTGEVESDEDAPYNGYEEEDTQQHEPIGEEQEQGGGAAAAESDADFIAYSDEEDEEENDNEDASDREEEEIRTADLPLPPLPPPVPPVKIHNMETEEVYNIIRELRRQVDHEASREEIRQLLQNDTSVLLAVAQVLHESKLMRRIGVNAHGVREEQVLPLPEAAAPTLPAGYTSWVNAAQLLAENANRAANPRASARLAVPTAIRSEQEMLSAVEKRAREPTTATSLLPLPAPARSAQQSNVEVVVGNQSVPAVRGHGPPLGGAYPARGSRRGGQGRQGEW